MKEIIEKYKKHIQQFGLSDELFKWEILAKYKGRPSIESDKFVEEFKSIDFKNLLFYNAIAVRNHLLRDKSEEYRKCFEILFDESKPLRERIAEFDKAVLEVYRTLISHLGHHHDERTIATFLTFYNPDRYTFYKDSFYRKYCLHLGIKPMKKGNKYVHYMELVNKFINEYIKPNTELIDIFKSKLPPDDYSDPNYLILAQDILYRTFDKNIGSDKAFWRIGTSDDTKSYWNEMYESGHVGIGWSEIGNLSDNNVSSKKDLEILLKGHFQYDNKTLSRKAGEIYNFYNEIKNGDIIVAQNGYEVLGVGIVTDEYFYDSTYQFAHRRPVNWIITNCDLTNKEGNLTTVFCLKDFHFLNKINQLINDIQPKAESQSTMNPTLNQILFGPPGTGKTYNSIKIAVKIANPTFSEMQWEDIKEEFDSLVDSGQIVFTTFHQSMSYEDFIEGIKPITDDESGNVTYEVQKGFFRQICDEARRNYQLSHTTISKTQKVDFDTLWGAFIEEITDKIESNEEFKLTTLTKKTFKVSSISDRGNINVIPLDNGRREYIVSYQRAKKLYEAFPDLNNVSNIDKEFRSIIGGSNTTSYWSVISYLQNNINIPFNLPIETPKNYVIVIDEINRGNVSQIFGELITLIEEDKRENKKEALKVMLPYSKEKFSVPQNLYIIGTMNTADRSVEALDTALRRRFSFVEMPPKYDLEELNYVVTDDIKATDILTKINLRLEKLLDKDHLIGHSFFICKEGETPLEKVRETFYKNIIPLLQEYFYGDYGKIGLVLGKGFVRKKDSSEQSVFAEFEGYESNFDDRTIYEIVDYSTNNETDAFMNALTILMK